MWTLADKITRTLSDVTIGTVILLAHVTLVSRDTSRRRMIQPEALPDGTRIWRTQISP